MKNITKARDAVHRTGRALPCFSAGVEPGGLGIHRLRSHCSPSRVLSLGPTWTSQKSRYFPYLSFSCHVPDLVPHYHHATSTSLSSPLASLGHQCLDSGSYTIVITVSCVVLQPCILSSPACSRAPARDNSKCKSQTYCFLLDCGLPLVSSSA